MSQENTNPTQEERDREQEQMMLAEREARRAEMMHRNLDYGGVQGISRVIIAIVLVAAFFALLYYLSLD
jgi:hypothetical protein